jgi:transcriptional regulator with XRE-family HTH domain
MTVTAIDLPPVTYQALVASEVRAAIARVGVTQKQVAFALGQKEAWLSRRTKGHTPFTPDELAAIAAYLHVSVATLMPEPSADLHYCINSLSLDFEPSA